MSDNEDNLTETVLNNGYVKFIDALGYDEAIIESARMSTSGAFVSWEPYEGHPKGDQGLLEYLYKNKHMSPFEFCEMVVEVKAPIFVVREWQRHRTMSYNEMSARYTQMPNEHYVPDASRIKLQDLKNRQGSAFHVTESVNDFIEDVEYTQKTLYSEYEMFLGDGIARELARINTPVSRMTKMRVKANLRNWLQFLQLRLADNAQYEIRVYAQVVAKFIQEIFPRTYDLFERYTLNTVTISRAEYETLKNSRINTV